MKKDCIERACAYCEKGCAMLDGESTLCKLRGPVSSAYSCRHFTFDPLKITAEPRRLRLNTKIETL